jgi:hypothetical protein
MKVTTGCWQTGGWLLLLLLWLWLRLLRRVFALRFEQECHDRGFLVQPNETL